MNKHNFLYLYLSIFLYFFLSFNYLFRYILLVKYYSLNLDLYKNMKKQNKKVKINFIIIKKKING